MASQPGLRSFKIIERLSVSGVIRVSIKSPAIQGSKVVYYDSDEDRTRTADKNDCTMIECPDDFKTAERSDSAGGESAGAESVLPQPMHLPALINT